jgi:predicted DNA-binding helix-hairpin-helix protein
VIDTIRKLKLLGPATRYEPAEDVDMMGRRQGYGGKGPAYLRHCISHATLPGGKRIPMLKTLVSSACEMNCRYCAFRAGRDFRRATFTPDELAYLSSQMVETGLIQGVFLSSGLVGGGVKTQDTLIATAELLRRKYAFRGYLHVKIMPGAERDQVAETMRWANRVSLNLEAPNQERLSHLAPRKEFSGELLQRLRWVQAIRMQNPEFAPSTTTQFVVGPAGESDLELLATCSYLYRHLGLARAYFSGFSPVADTPFEDHPPIALKREMRLYQASFLLRDYGFDVEDMPFNQSGQLPLSEDPKLAWAKRHLRDAPVEVNTADREMLLRVPGIGLKSADRIVEARRSGTLDSPYDLRNLGIATKRILPFVLLNGRQSPQQLSLWSMSTSPDSENQSTQRLGR